MKGRHHVLRAGLGLSAVLLAASLSAPMSGANGATATATATEAAGPVASWADRVWDVARHGDPTLLEQTLEAVPADAVSERAASRFKESLARLSEHRAAAADRRDEERAEALDEMRTEIEAGRQAIALRHAVVAQSHSADYDAFFQDEEVMDLVNWAEDAVVREERARRWIDAQELLYLLRTFYEDTDRQSDYRRHERELEIVNQRVGLLARYAPRVLYEMRSDRAVRLGEDELPPFNDAQVVDWRERLDDIDRRMLVALLTRAAEEHIEGAGWRPLLEGGLESVRTIATTTPLKAVFPRLADADAVATWRETVEAWEREVDAAGGVGRATFKAMLDDLLEVNERTVDLPEAVVLREFGDGAMARLDTYSDIVWPDELRRFEQQTAGDFVGVGILIRHNDKREIMVVNPLEGTPAYQAGVRPEDVIVSVDGESTAGWTLNDAVDEITGRRRTTVTLGVRREGVDDEISIPIVRDVIKIHSVKGWRKVGIEDDGEPIWSWYIDEDSNVGYVRLTQFTQSSLNDLLEAWAEMKLAGGRPRGLILDLRHNPGGLLAAAVRISNLFLPSGEIVSGENKDGRREWGQSAQRHYAAFAGVPTVVLVNKGSASASEIVAGALQAHGAAVVVGERSFGKGSVQTVHTVTRDGKLKLTTQYYRLPSPDGGRTPGRLVHKRPGVDVWGVDPDVEVPMTARQVSDAIELRQRAERAFLLDDGGADEGPADIQDLLAEGIDPQLQVALLILQAQAMVPPADREERHASRR